MKSIKRILSVVLTVLMVCGMILPCTMMTASALEGVGKSDTYTRIHGIDLSYWNVGGSTLNYSLVDFDKLVASGCEFAILRIGLGSSSNTCSMDKAFLEYYKRARAAGMKLGCYFYSHALTYAQAANEAKWVINVIESNDMYFEYPIYTDMEESDQTALSSSAFTNVALGFCETMEAAGYYPAMYGANSSMSKLTSSFCKRYDRWTAKVKANETTSNRFYWNTYDYSDSFGMWQYTWEGQKIFSGIGASMLDVNICYKDYPAIMEKYGYNNIKGGSTADKLGTYYITAPADDPLNVRDSASTSGNKVDTVQVGDLVDVTELSGNWGKFVSPNGSTGWASIKNYSNYIGVDALAYQNGAAWGEVSTSVGTDGSMTLVNNSAEQIAYDFNLPFDIGTSTTPYFAIQVVPNSGNGYYFGLTQAGSGYFMMRDCNSGDQLVNEATAPYMTGTETLEINVSDWWKPAENYRINQVRMYVAPQSSITINYMYFAANSGVVTSPAYNLKSGTASSNINYTLMDPNTLSVVDATKTGGYTYTNGLLAVTSGEDSGYAVKFDLNKAFNINDVHRLLMAVDSQVNFDIELLVTTSDGDRTFGLVADFGNGINGDPVNGYIPAMTGSRGLDFKSCYTWNNVLPADGMSTVKTVTVKVDGKGTLYVSSLQLANTDAIAVFADDVNKSQTTPDAVVDPEPGPAPSYERGDINSDGEVSTVDARIILQSSVGQIAFSESQKQAADYNGDGSVSTVDVRAILKHLIG
ncbi:MAG: SH3 domain-containing protein [Clostridia bacterium]|nr:SH3 domain-containing protein [Clostridia bacterium]